MKKAISLFFATTTISSDLGLLALRLAAGLMMAFGHGLDKIKKLPPTDEAIAKVADMGFPIPSLFAWGPALSEFVFSLCIVLGLFTRLSAFMWLCTMATAAFIAHGGQEFGNKEKALLYGTIAICLLIAGPGRLSADHFIAKALGFGKSGPKAEANDGSSKSE